MNMPAILLTVAKYFAVFAGGALAILLLAAAGVFDLFHKKVPPSEWGSFPATPKVGLLDDGRLLQLLEDFAYIDPRGRVWTAPKESLVDGASIPRVFWPITGGPLEGQYRNASIVHDVGCDRRTERSEDVHYMFYQACRCGGVGEIQAKVLYAAVYHFGPRWVLKRVQAMRSVIGPDGKVRQLATERTVSERIQPPEEPDQEVRKKLEKYITERNPSLDELKKLDPKSL